MDIDLADVRQHGLRVEHGDGVDVVELGQVSEAAPQMHALVICVMRGTMLWTAGCRSTPQTGPATAPPRAAR